MGSRIFYAIKYQGSKRRLARQLINVIFEHASYNDNTIFYDVFCGSCSIGLNVPLKNIVMVDNNQYLIEALRIICTDPDQLPKNNKEFTEDDYKDIMRNKYSDKYPKWLVGYVGFNLSFGGKWFGGWRRSRGRDFVAEAYRAALRAYKRFQEKSVVLICSDYRHVPYEKDSIIYCDPPYAGTTGYAMKWNAADYNNFWEWCRWMARNGYQIFISEKQAPDDFTPIWEAELTITVNNKDYKKHCEKLFVYKK